MQSEQFESVLGDQIDTFNICDNMDIETCGLYVTPSCDSPPNLVSNSEKLSRSETYFISSCDSQNVTCIPICSYKSNKPSRPDAGVISSFDSLNVTCMSSCSDKSDKLSRQDP